MTAPIPNMIWNIHLKHTPSVYKHPTFFFGLFIPFHKDPLFARFNCF